MIEKNIEYGNGENVTIAIFGKGDIGFYNIYAENGKIGDIIFFHPEKPHAINRITKIEDISKIDPELVFRFNGKNALKSINSLINQLKDLKADLKKAKLSNSSKSET